jgi:transcription initiation factor TFIID subunit 9B
MDFAYRYTSSILGDALHIQNEGYDQAENTTQTKSGRGAAAKNAAQKAEEGDVSMPALRMSIASRMSHQFQGHANLPKEYLKQLADERNRISLNAQAKDEKGGVGVVIGGIRLPHERYCLTGAGWGLKEEWDSEGEESVEEEGDAAPVVDGDDMQMDEMGEGDEEGIGDMEDVFGADDAQPDKDGDEEMQDS